MSANALRSIVARVGIRAGIVAPVTPHMMRHGFADFVGREAGVHNASALLGHASIATTQIYLGSPTPDDLTAAISQVTFGSDPDWAMGPQDHPQTR